MKELASYMRGWVGYFGFCETPEVLIALGRIHPSPCLACCAISGIACTAVAPVPITATRLAVKSTPSCGYWLVWYHLPLNEPSPLNGGTLVADRLPTTALKETGFCRSCRHARMR
jgi:hypothetical protein